MQCKVLLNISKQSMRKTKGVRAMKTKLSFRRVILAVLLITLLNIAQGCSKEKPGISKYFPVQTEKSGTWNLMDMDGNLILDKGLEHRPMTATEGIFYILKKGSFEYYKAGKEPLKIGTAYFDGSIFSEGLAAVVQGEGDDGIIQYIDHEGVAKITLHKLDGMRVTAASIFSEGMAWVKNENDKYGFIDKSGTLVIPFKYDYARPFHEGRALVSQDAEFSVRTGFIDAKGEEVIKLTDQNYYFADFQEGYTTFRDNSNGYHGTIDTTGKIAIDINKEFYHIGSFVNGEADFYDENAQGLAATKGNVVVKPKYEEITIIPAANAVRSDNKCRELDFEGKEIFDMTDQYESIVPWADGKYLVKDGSFAIFVDQNGKQIGNDRYYDFDERGFWSHMLKTNVDIYHSGAGE